MNMVRLLLLLSVLLAYPALAAEFHIGTIESPGISASNANTAAPFGLLSPRHYAVQCDAPAYVVAGPVATPETGVLVAADQLYDVPLPSPVITISIISQGAEASCKVFSVRA